MKFISFFICLFMLAVKPVQPAEALIAKAIGGDSAEEQKGDSKYIETTRDLLSLIDKPEKREKALKKIETLVKTELSSFDLLKSITIIILKILVTYLVYWGMRRAVFRMISYQMEFLVSNRVKDETSAIKAKAHRCVIEETIEPLFERIASWALRIIFGIIILDILHFNVTPLLFSFSFIGIALTFASQNMLKDVVTGIMTLTKGTMAIGEVIEIGDTKGVVESVDLRFVSIRLATGAVRTIPFSEISTILNYSRNYNLYSSKTLISYEEDTDRVEACYIKAYDRLINEFGYKDQMLETEFKFHGILEFTSKGYRYSGSIKTLPDPYSLIGYKFNKLVHEEMRKDDIKFPKEEGYHHD